MVWCPSHLLQTPADTCCQNLRTENERLKRELDLAREEAQAGRSALADSERRLRALTPLLSNAQGSAAEAATSASALLALFSALERSAARVGHDLESLEETAAQARAVARRQAEQLVAAMDAATSAEQRMEAAQEQTREAQAGARDAERRLLEMTQQRAREEQARRSAAASLRRAAAAPAASRLAHAALPGSPAFSRASFTGGVVAVSPPAATADAASPTAASAAPPPSGAQLGARSSRALVRMTASFAYGTGTPTAHPWASGDGAAPGAAGRDDDEPARSLSASRAEGRAGWRPSKREVLNQAALLLIRESLGGGKKWGADYPAPPRLAFSTGCIGPDAPPPGGDSVSPSGGLPGPSKVWRVTADGASGATAAAGTALWQARQSPLAGSVLRRSADPSLFQ